MSTSEAVQTLFASVAISFYSAIFLHQLSLCPPCILTPHPPCLPVWLFSVQSLSLSKIHGVFQPSLVLSLTSLKRHGRRGCAQHMTEEGCNSEAEALGPLRMGYLAASASLILTMTHMVSLMTMAVWSDELQLWSPEQCAALAFRASEEIICVNRDAFNDHFCYKWMCQSLFHWSFSL